MKIAVYSCQTYDREYLTAAAGAEFDLSFFDARLTPDTTPLADGFEAVCCFVNDQLDGDVLQLLASVGVRLILLRCAGFNNADLNAASRLGLTVMRVPEYSPHAVAEHTLALLLCVNRNLHRAWGRVREGDFRLQGLLGFDLYGKTVGVVGTGRIGACVCRILLGFGCRVLAFDTFPSDELHRSGVQYVPMQTLLTESQVITLHCPLTEETRHLINRETLAATTIRNAQTFVDGAPDPATVICP